MNTTAEKQTLGFQTEVRQLLQLMIHSLYSNKEIFLRELISNASDAADKLRFEALSASELLEDDAELGIRIEFDKDANTLAVIDNGIGMSREELVQNLGTIARSGTSEFLSQMTGDEKKDASLIGQFGVGFYSAFIVADRVVVESRRAGVSAGEAVRWESDGQGEFSVEQIERDARGTRVELQLKDDDKEFADRWRLDNLIRKYSDHIGFPVTLAGGDEDDSVVNSATALWTRSRSDISDDEYKEFYKHLSHDFADPLSWSHNRVEGKREYTSLLYLPSTAPFDLWNREAPRGLKLYVQRVFIMDDAEQFLPLYLRFIRGVVDSSDLPLNVSRELLQQNPELTAMRSALTKRALDMIKKLANGDDYASFWSQFGQVMKEGVVEDPANKEALAGLLRFSSTALDDDSQARSLDDYLDAAGPEQDKIYYLLSDNVDTAKGSPHIEKLRADGIEVLLLTDRIDPWLADSLTEFKDKAVVNAAKESAAETEESKALNDEANKEHKPLLKKIRKVLSERVRSVNVSQRLVDSAACVVAADDDLTPQLRQMLEASGQTLPDSKPILEVNMGHPLLQRLDAEHDDDRFEALAGIVLDHALLAEGSQLENPADYVSRMNSLLLELDSGAAAA
ncbi:MAG: molecular chaperone HtpG [Pseudomonadota bacterium]